jgi:hypothetical protein
MEVALFSPDVRTLASPKSKEKLAMKRFVMTVILTVALSSFAFAGEIPSDGSPAPTPNGSSPTATTTAPGEIPTDGSAGQISDAAVSVLLTVFGLLA